MAIESDGLDRRRLLKGTLAGIGGIAALRPRGLVAQTKAPVSALALAEILNGVTFADLPNVAVKHAKMILASTLASAASGSGIGSVRIIRDLAKDQGGRKDAPLWFDGARLPVTEAARVNAMQSDAAASDDSDLRNVAHTGTCLTAVGLAMGECSGATGQELLGAMVAGYESAGRIGEALAASRAAGSNGAISGRVGRGFHASSIVAFGGVVTAAKLLKLTEEQMANAIAITATSVGGLAIGTNSWAREYHAGNAALTAVNAALAASKGYIVNPDMLENGGGFLAIFGDGNADSTALARPIRGDYQIERYLAVKLVPGAHALHSAVEAAVNASREAGAKADDLTKILVAGPQSGLVAGRPPADVIEAIHSLSYYVAAAVADKDFTWKHAEPEMIQRPEIVRLIGLVEQDKAPPSVRYEWGWGATVTIVTKSGARFSSTVDAPRGSAPRGIEWSDIDAKFRALMPQSKLPAGRVEDILKSIHEFDQVRKVSAFTGLLT